MPAGSDAGDEGRERSFHTGRAPRCEVRCTDRTPATRHAHEIAIDPLRRCRRRSARRPHARGSTPCARVTAPPAISRAPAALAAASMVCRRIGAWIDDRRDGDAGAGQVGDRARRLVVGAEHDRAPPGRHSVAVEIGPHGAGQHDAGTIVVAEHQRPLDRAGSNDATPGEDAPEPLARLVRRRRRHVIVDALERGIGAVVVDAERPWCAAGCERRAAPPARPRCGRPSLPSCDRPARDSRRSAGRRGGSPARTARRARRSAPPPARPSAPRRRRRPPARRNAGTPSRRRPDRHSWQRARARPHDGSVARTPSPRTKPAT